MALAACWAVAAGRAAAAPTGYRTTELAGIGSGISAVAYAPDGTLYVAEMGSSDLTVIAPDGARSSLPLVGAALVGPSGMWVGPAGTTVYVADNKNFADGAGDLYAVRVADGQAETVLSGIDFIDDVAVRSTGEIFIADAAGMGFGAVYQAVYDNVGGSYSAVPVVTGLDFVAGLAFDPAGNLIYQQAATFDFIGEVYRLPIIDGGGPWPSGRRNSWRPACRRRWTWPWTARPTCSSAVAGGFSNSTATPAGRSRGRPRPSATTVSRPKSPSAPGRSPSSRSPDGTTAGT